MDQGFQKPHYYWVNMESQNSFQSYEECEPICEERKSLRERESHAAFVGADEVCKWGMTLQLAILYLYCPILFNVILLNNK